MPLTVRPHVTVDEFLSAAGSFLEAPEAEHNLLLGISNAIRVTPEALPEAPPLPDPGAAAERWIARLGRMAYLWEDGDEVVSWVGAGGETPHGIRIGPVHTPPQLRSRGHAGSLTAAASADQLEHGRRFCFLFTDLANPTSNKIYRAIGYQPVGDVDQYRFRADA